MRARFVPRSPSVVLGAFMLALGVFWAPSASATTTTLNVPLRGATFSGCVPPGAALTGHMKVTFRHTVNINAIHTGMESNACGSKIVTPIGEFVSNENHFNEFKVPLNGSATVFTIHDRFKYVSPGAGEDYLMDAEMHVTVNSNGEVSAEFTRIHIDCYVECCGGAEEVVE